MLGKAKQLIGILAILFVVEALIMGVLMIVNVLSQEKVQEIMLMSAYVFGALFVAAAIVMLVGGLTQNK